MKVEVRNPCPLRLTFEDLRRRWPGADGRPMAVRTARRHAKRVGHLKLGRAVLFPEAEVAEYERKHFLKT